MGLRAESRLGLNSTIEEVREVPDTRKSLKIVNQDPSSFQDEDDEDSLSNSVPLVPLRRRPSCLPDLLANDSLLSVRSGLSTSYSENSTATYTPSDSHRMSSIKLKETKMKMRKFLGKIAERTESIREKVPQVGLQRPFGQQVKIL